MNTAKKPRSPRIKRPIQDIGERRWGVRLSVDRIRLALCGKAPSAVFRGVTLRKAKKKRGRDRVSAVTILAALEQGARISQQNWTLIAKRLKVSPFYLLADCELAHHERGRAAGLLVMLGWDGTPWLAECGVFLRLDDIPPGARVFRPIREYEFRLVHRRLAIARERDRQAMLEAGMLDQACRPGPCEIAEREKLDREASFWTRFELAERWKKWLLARP